MISEQGSIEDIPEPYDSAHKGSAHHRAQVEAALFVGCFYCLTMYGSGEIKEWIDGGQTALCPHFGIDSVLPLIDGKPKIGFLLEMHRYWF